MAADALVLKVREGGRVVNVHALLAVGVNAGGHREIRPRQREVPPGLEVTSSEDDAGWLAFFRSLVARGLSGVPLVTSDAHAGLVAAIGATLPGASWQRCRTHYLRDLLTITPKSAQPAVATSVRSIFDQPDAVEVHAQVERVLDCLTDKLPAAAAHVAARGGLLAFTGFPQPIWRQLWSNNPPRAAEPGDPPPHRPPQAGAPPVVGIFPARDALIRLVGAVLAWGYRPRAGAQHDEWTEGRRYLGLDVLARSRITLIDGDQTEEVNEAVTTHAITA